MDRKTKRTNTNNKRRTTYRPRKRYRPPRTMTKIKRIINMSTGGLLNPEIKFLDVNISETPLKALTHFKIMAIQPTSGYT